jgi:hypothetical protein
VILEKEKQAEADAYKLKNKDQEATNDKVKKVIAKKTEEVKKEKEEKERDEAGVIEAEKKLARAKYEEEIALRRDKAIDASYKERYL